MEHITTYNFYDEDSRRLSAFCRFISETKAEIFILRCSTKDQFKKKFARLKYEEYLEKGKCSDVVPEIIVVDIVPEERELKTLLRYMRKNFYLLRVVLISIESLISYDEYKKFSLKA